VVTSPIAILKLPQKSLGYGLDEQAIKVCSGNPHRRDSRPEKGIKLQRHLTDHNPEETVDLGRAVRLTR
jgi:hypothetical protein